MEEICDFEEAKEIFQNVDDTVRPSSGWVQAQGPAGGSRGLEEQAGAPVLRPSWESGEAMGTNPFSIQPAVCGVGVSGMKRTLALWSWSGTCDCKEQNSAI